jgi:acetolactate synthase-1/2/3 large subunit
MDGVPVVAITGQVPTRALGTDAFQETDVLGVTMPVTKHGFMVERAEDLETIVCEAFRIARGGRPGPVVIDIPKDVQSSPWRAATPSRNGRSAGAIPPAAAAVRAIEETLAPHALDTAARLLNDAARPLVLAGRGIVASGSAPLLRSLAERADLPVVTTLLGLDGFPATHPLALGMPGMHGTVRACHAIQRADVILGLGIRFDDRVTGAPGTFARNATIVHADIDPGCFGRTVHSHVRLPGDLRATLPALLARIAARRQPEWWHELRQWPREAAPDEPVAEPCAPLTGRAACRGLAARIARARAIVVTDVGQHQMWLAQELGDADPGTHLTSGGLGTMGYALPAALGAATGRRDRAVWVVAGDGGFQMTLQELATVVQEALPLRIAVVNNGFLGMVRQWQELFYQRRYSASELSGPDLPCLARAYGIPARAVERQGELDDALDWADAARGPVLLDLRVAREENVYPMVPPGAALDQVVPAPALAIA